MRLTSSVKELEAILQKLINLDKIQNENTMVGVDLAKAKAKRNVLTRTGNEKKKESRLNSVD
jgi:hypothetical protein